MMREWTELVEAIERSSFRSRFRLGPREWAYCREKGMETIAAHAREFIRTRLAPAQPATRICGAVEHTSIEATRAIRSICARPLAVENGASNSASSAIV